MAGPFIVAPAQVKQLRAWPHWSAWMRRIAAALRMAARNPMEVERAAICFRIETWFGPVLSLRSNAYASLPRGTGKRILKHGHDVFHAVWVWGA